MGTQNHLAAAFEKVLAPEVPRPALEVSVVVIHQEALKAALKRAVELASGLNARITIIVAQIVPFPVPLSSPPVLVDFQESCLRQIASKCPMETAVRIYLCREPWEILETVLAPRSLIVLGRRRKWWPVLEETRLARSLRRSGHEVMVADSE